MAGRCDARVQYNEVYPGIDLVFHGRQSQPEFDFELAAGADPSRIRLNLSGHQRLTRAPDGSLTIDAAGGQIRWNRPVVTQAGAFQTTYKGNVGQPTLPRFGMPFRRLGDVFVTKINPGGTQLIYSTLLGGQREEAPPATISPWALRSINRVTSSSPV